MNICFNAFASERLRNHVKGVFVIGSTCYDNAGILLSTDNWSWGEGECLGFIKGCSIPTCTGTIELV